MLHKLTTSGLLTRPLRIAVLTARPEGFENWELRIFDRLKADPRFSLITFLVHPKPFEGRRDPRLFRLVSRLEQATLARQKPYVPVVFDPRRHTFERLSSPGHPSKIDARLTADLIDELELDLVLRLTPAGLPDSVIRKLPFGEWAFSFTAQRSEGADWSGYAHVIGKKASTGLQLFMRRGDGLHDTCIASSAFNIKFSAERNGAFVKERAVTLLMRELGRLAETGDTETAVSPSTSSEVPPSATDLLRYAAGLTAQLANRAVKTFKAKAGIGSTVWTLYSGHGSIGDFDPRRAVEIPPSGGEIRADPFLFQHENTTYLFYEAYAPGAKKAHIAVGRLEAGRLTPLGVALERDHHLSYPFVFRHGADLFMMPETNQARRIEIWRCVDFPLKWELYSTGLVGQSPADSMLTQHAGRWWLFTNLSDFHAYEDHCSELHIFEVDGPALGRITPHKRNPVVIDSTVARNAGRMFETGGKLYRPSQRNEWGIYGYGLNVMEIETLDLENYSERCVRIIRPDFKPGLMGCHHFDAVDGRYVIDARLSQ